MSTPGTQRCIALRAEVPADRALSLAAYASTRCADLALTNWLPAQQEAFVAQQFDAQHRYYRAQFPQARFDIVTVDGTDVGRCYVDRDPQRICLIDIVLLPEWRGMGIGAHLLGNLIAEADVQQLPIALHVEKHNPILGWYTRLGFVAGGDVGVYLSMRRDALRLTSVVEAAA